MTDILALHMDRMPLLAVLRGISEQEVIPVGEALVKQGVTLLEVTMDSPNALDSLSRMSSHFGEDAFIAAGTVLKPQQVTPIAQAGAQAIVSPNFKQTVVEAAKDHDLISMPGVFTPSECFDALDAGADGLKLFPGDGMSPKMVKGIRAVVGPNIRMMVTGGVDANNLSDWLMAGLNGVGIGSALYKPGKSAADIESSAQAFVQAVAVAREKGWGA